MSLKASRYKRKVTKSSNGARRAGWEVNGESDAGLEFELPVWESSGSAGRINCNSGKCSAWWCRFGSVSTENL